MRFILVHDKIKEKKLIKLEKVTKLLELAFYSAYIKDEQPVSALVTAPPEAGKTQGVMRFAGNQGIVVLTDCTAYGIMRDYGASIKEKKVRHLVIPDLVRPLSRSKDTVHSLVAFLNAIIEEGVVSISTYAEKLGVPEGKDKEQPIPVKCGLVATLAKDILEDGRHQWSSMGFMSRLLPISYEYSTSTKLEIHKSIANRDYKSDELITLNFPTEDIALKLELKEAQELMLLSGQLAEGNAEKTYGFRLQKHIQRLAMANALKQNRDVVNTEDVQLLQELSDCINLAYYPM